MILFIPIFMAKLYGHVLNLSMQLLGMQIPSAIIQFSEKQDAIFKHSGIPLSKDRIHDDVKILFKGIGDKAFIEINGYKTEVLLQDIQFLIKQPSKKAQNKK